MYRVNHLARAVPLAYWLFLFAMAAKLISADQISIAATAAATLILCFVRLRLLAVNIIISICLLAAIIIPWPQALTVPPLVQLGLSVGFWTELAVLGAALFLCRLPDNFGKNPNQHKNES